MELYGIKERTCKHCKKPNEVQKGVDVAITTLLLKHAFQNLADRIVLFSGVGDFEQALRVVKSELHKQILGTC